MTDHTIAYSDDVRNAIGTLLASLVRHSKVQLPARPPVVPEALHIVGGSSGLHSVVMHGAPAWRGTTRVEVVDDLIVVSVLRDGQWCEAWRSDGQPLARQVA
jgi:hypothetical protein